MNKNVFILFFFVVLSVNYVSYGSPGDWFNGILTGIGLKSADVGGKHLVAAAANLGQDGKVMAEVLAEGTKVAAGTLAEGATEASANLGIEAVNTVTTVAAPLLAVYSVWSMAKDVTNGCTSVYNWYYPTIEARNREAECARRLAFLRAEDVLLKTLVAHRCSQRGASGLPVACESSAQDLIAAGGGERVAKVTDYFQNSALLNDCPC